MFALIMSGGKATRLGMGEKALTRLRDKPLISYVLEAISESGLDPVVIVSPLTPYTTNYCRTHHVEWICTDGYGYVEDIRQAIMDLSINGPVLTICADLPGITSHHINTVLERYYKSGLPACSVWCESHNEVIMREKIQDNPHIPNFCNPVGLNIIRGDLIDQEQDEIKIILDDPLLALNINTREDLIAAEKVLDSTKKSNIQPTLL